MEVNARAWDMVYLVMYDAHIDENGNYYVINYKGSRILGPKSLDLALSVGFSIYPGV